MTRDDLDLLNTLGFTGGERRVRASLKTTGAACLMAGAALLAEHFDWWPKEPVLWAATALLAGGVVALLLARRPGDL